LPFSETKQKRREMTRCGEWRLRKVETEAACSEGSARGTVPLEQAADWQVAIEQPPPNQSGPVWAALQPSRSTALPWRHPSGSTHAKPAWTAWTCFRTG